MNMEATFKCPTDSQSAHDIVGCGAVFTATPDEEGFVDCPECGMWFRAGDVVDVPEELLK